MVSPLSGFREEVELVKIEHRDFSLRILGRPFHERYEGLRQYRSMDRHDEMQFLAVGEHVESIQVLDVNTMELQEETNVRPVFFENGIYQLMIISKNGKQLSFYHEHSKLRDSVNKLHNTEILLGNLQFQNEVGLTSFEIREGNETLLDVTLEIFPTKLDYKKDYVRLLNEVNDEIYNLAFHFIKKTYLGAKVKLDGEPSQVEFYRLLTEHFDQFNRAILRIEKQPHHKLVQNYQKVRGDQLRKNDARTRKYLQQRSHLFVEVNRGIDIHGNTYMPREGLRAKKELTYDTTENRYVKWMMERLIHKITDLIERLQAPKRFETKPDDELLNRLEGMKRTLEERLKQLFWRNIGRLDRSVMSLVLQMSPGYRDAFQLYLTISKGLMLEGNVYKMSVKDVATLYEYWTFLKIGQILSKKYIQVDQDIINVNRDGLFVKLEENKPAKRVFKHPATGEKIELIYQKYVGKLPTASQKPDTMLSIQKKGKAFDYEYVFDAKYRVDYALGNDCKTPGPMEEDINTMHRYRDAIVAEKDGPYERTAFGAYVLFPWTDEEVYKNHNFYKSIEKVNIGGLPFLPNTTDLVEQFIERLIERSPEELQNEGILPRGAYEEWQSSLSEKVLVGLVASTEEYKTFSRNSYYSISAASLKKGWQEAKYMALYVKKDVTSYNGVYEYSEIDRVEQNGNEICFYVKAWKKLKQVINPVHYGIATYMMTEFTQLQDARELPELYMKSKDEMQLWRTLRRVSDSVHLQLDEHEIDEASKITEFEFEFKKTKVRVLEDQQQIMIEKQGEQSFWDMDDLLKQPSKFFRAVLEY